MGLGIEGLELRIQGPRSESFAHRLSAIVLQAPESLEALGSIDRRLRDSSFGLQSCWQI